MRHTLYSGYRIPSLPGTLANRLSMKANLVVDYSSSFGYLLLNRYSARYPAKWPFQWPKRGTVLLVFLQKLKVASSTFSSTSNSGHWENLSTQLRQYLLQHQTTKTRWFWNKIVNRCPIWVIFDFWQAWQEPLTIMCFLFKVWLHRTWPDVV